MKLLILHAILEDDNGHELYELAIIEHMQVVWGDMEVTLQDSKTRNNVFKVRYLDICIKMADIPITCFDREARLEAVICPFCQQVGIPTFLLA